MKIQTKLLIGFLSLSLLAALGGYLEFLQLKEIAKPLNKISLSIEQLNRASEIEKLAYRLQYFGEVLSQSTRNYAFTQHKQWEQRYHAFNPEFHDIIQQALERSDQDNKPFFKRIEAAQRELTKIERSVIQQINQNLISEAVKLLEGERYRQQKHLFESGLQDYFLKHGAGEKQMIAVKLIARQTQETLQDSTMLTLIFGIAILTLAVIISLLITQSIAHPLKSLTSYTQRISQGELSLKVDIASNDEIGSLASSFQQMANTLQKTYSQLEQKIEERTTALQQQTQITRSIVETAPTGIITINEQGIIQSFNSEAEKLFGYPVSEMIGQNVNLLMSEPYQSEHDDYLKRYLDTGVGKIIGTGREVEGRRRDGTAFPLYLSVGEVKLGDQRLFTGIIEDITERKQTEERIQNLNQQLATHIEDLERSNQELQQFAYIASHDLQAPLRAIINYLQLLEERFKEQLDEKGVNYISRAIESSKRMQTLIQDLLNYSKVDKHQEEFTEIECESVYKIALENLQTTIRENDAQITHDALPKILGNQSQFIQLFQNLIGNAIKYCSQEIPRVHIKTKRQNNDWVFSIRDNGIGIDAEFFDRIFVIFQRLHSRGEYSGNGIGLPICKKIIEYHGGHIWVESQPGQGSTFYFTIPIHEEL